MAFSKLITLSACALLLSSVAPNFAQAQDDSGTRLSRMEAQIDTLSRAVFKGDVPATNMPTPLSAPSSDYQASVEARLSELEKQNRDLTGRIEQLSFENLQLKTRLDKALTDIELRFQDGSAQSPAISDAPQIDTEVETPNLTSPPKKQTGILAPQDMGGPVIGDETELTAIPPVPVADKNAPAPANSPTVQNLGIVNTPITAPKVEDEITAKDATAQYEMAFSQLKSGNYAPARAGFENFLKDNPTHPLAANATYWLGESYYGQGEYDKAARVFAESYKKYPKGPKLADSLLKMGMSLGSAGKKKEACVTLAQLKKEFTTGQNVTLRRADQEMKKLACN